MLLISLIGIKFLRNVLEEDPKLRMTGAKVMEHPWLRGQAKLVEASRRLTNQATLNVLATRSEIAPRGPPGRPKLAGIEGTRRSTRLSQKPPPST